MALLRNIFARWFGPKKAPEPFDFERDASAATRASYLNLKKQMRLHRLETLNAEIARLRRNKKRHSHLVAERDALLAAGATQ